MGGRSGRRWSDVVGRRGGRRLGTDRGYGKGGEQSGKAGEAGPGPFAARELRAVRCREQTSKHDKRLQVVGIMRCGWEGSLDGLEAPSAVGKAERAARGGVAGACAMRSNRV